MDDPPRCLVTDELLDRMGGSLAHIVPNAMGGRLAFPSLLSPRGNEILNRKFDLPLIKAFSPLSSMVDVYRDRGRNRTTRMEGPDGAVYQYHPDEPLRPDRPSFSVTPHEDGGQEVRIVARTMSEMRTLLGRLKKADPAVDIDEMLSLAREEQVEIGGKLKGGLQIGPRVVFPAAFIMANLCAAHHAVPPASSFREYVAGYDPDEELPNLPPQTFYFFDDRPYLDDETLGHLICLVSSRDRSRLLFLVELFGFYCVGVVLPNPNAVEIEFSHAVDVVSGRMFTPPMDFERLRSRPWEATHSLGEPAFYEIMQGRMGRVMEQAAFRAHRQNVLAAMEEAIGTVDGRPLSEADIEGLARAMAEYWAPILVRRLAEQEAAGDIDETNE